MATVRLTQEIRTIVLDQIANNYKPLIAAYSVSHEDTERVAEIAASRINAAAAKANGLMSDLTELLKDTLPEAGRPHAKNMVNQITRVIGGHTTLRLKSESMSLAFNWNLPSSTVLAWEYPFLLELYAEEYPEVAQILEQRQAQKQVEEERDMAVKTAEALILNSKTLGQLVKKWPGVKVFVPQRFIDKMEDKTAYMNHNTAKPEVAPAPAPMDTRTLDNVLLRARAAAALQGDD